MPSVNPDYFRSIRRNYRDLQQQYQSIDRQFHGDQFDPYEIILDLGRFYDGIMNDVIIKIENLFASQKLRQEEKIQDYENIVQDSQRMREQAIYMCRDALQMGPFRHMEIEEFAEYEIYRMATRR